MTQPDTSTSNVHICRATGQTYVARARHRGYRRYTLLGKPFKSEDKAIRLLASMMAKVKYKRGDVLLCADYYDPIVVFEMVRR